MGGRSRLNTLRAGTLNAWLTSRCGGAQQSVEDDGDQQQGGSSEHDACRVGVSNWSPDWRRNDPSPAGTRVWVSAPTHVVKRTHRVEIYWKATAGSYGHRGCKPEVHETVAACGAPALLKLTSYLA